MSRPSAQQSPTCEWAGCHDAATHTISIDPPEGSGRVWHVCSEHDTNVKVSVVRSRPRAASASPTDGSSAVIVQCERCRIPLDEPAELLIDQRAPCPICGSVGRASEVLHAATLSLEGRLTRRWKTGRRAKDRRVVTTGDAFTHATGTWGTCHRDVDPEHNSYREEIVLHDGTRIESRAKLSDHRGHGHDARGGRSARG